MIIISTTNLKKEEQKKKLQKKLSPPQEIAKEFMENKPTNKNQISQLKY